MRVCSFAIEEIKTRTPDALLRRPADHAIGRRATTCHVLIVVALILLPPRIHGQRGADSPQSCFGASGFRW